MLLKKHRHILILFLFFALGGLALLFLFSRDAGHQPAPKAYPYSPKPRRGFHFRGFQFNGHHEGRRVLSISADEFKIEKKKLGYFRFGILNVAILKNAKIYFYGEYITKNINSKKGLKKSNKSPGAKPASDEKKLVFKEVFRKDVLPSFQKKRVSAILIEPVCLFLHEGKNRICDICAGSASIRLRQRSMVFKGNVRVVAGPNTLTTEQLVLFPESATLEIEHPFLLKTPTQTLRGRRLTTDIRLSPMVASQGP